MIDGNQWLCQASCTWYWSTGSAGASKPAVGDGRARQPLCLRGMRAQKERRLCGVCPRYRLARMDFGSRLGQGRESCSERASHRRVIHIGSRRNAGRQLRTRSSRPGMVRPDRKKDWDWLPKPCDAPRAGALRVWQKVLLGHRKGSEA